VSSHATNNNEYYSLPYTTLFRSEEILFMLRRSDYEAWKGNILNCITRDYLRSLADELLDMGAVIAGFKLGHLGLYLRGNTAEAFGRLARLQLDARAWAGADVWQPAFQVEVRSEEHTSELQSRE